MGHDQQKTALIPQTPFSQAREKGAHQWVVGYVWPRRAPGENREGVYRHNILPCLWGQLCLCGSVSWREWRKAAPFAT